VVIDGRLEQYKEDEFPPLVSTGYRITSRASRFYNCFAWAAGDLDRWWNPLESDNYYYWPDGVPAELTLDAFIQAYGTLGYEPCDSSDWENGFEKIALYTTSDGEPTHADCWVVRPVLISLQLLQTIQHLGYRGLTFFDPPKVIDSSNLCYDLANGDRPSSRISGTRIPGNGRIKKGEMISACGIET
jgi:hypothetical protein